MDLPMSPNSHDDIRLDIVEIQGELKHLTQEVSKIAENISKMSDMKAEIKELQVSLTTIVGSQSNRLDDMKKDMDCLFNKTRAVEKDIADLKAMQTVNKDKIASGERVWWIVFAAAVGVASQFFKLKT